MQNCSKLLCSKYSANIFVTQCVSEQSGLLQDLFWGDVSFQNVHYFFFVSLEKMLSNQPTGFFPLKTIKQTFLSFKNTLSIKTLKFWRFLLLLWYWPKPAMSRTPMKLAEESKGKHWLTLVTTWSNRRLYTAFAKASRALLACSTLSGTLGKTQR